MLLRVPSVRVPRAPVAFVLEAPGDSELRNVLQAQAGLDVPVGPAVGPTGRVHDGLCRGAGIPRSECGHYNVIGTKLDGNDLTQALCGAEEHARDVAAGSVPHERVLAPVTTRGWLRRVYWPELERLYRELAEDRPRVVVALGTLAVWALTGSTAIGPMRSATGHATPWGRVFASYHPARAFRDGRLREELRCDYEAAWAAAQGRVLDRPVVDVQVWLPETPLEVEMALAMYVDRHPLVAVDIETSFIGRPPAWERWKRDVLGGVVADADADDAPDDDEAGEPAAGWRDAWPFRNDRRAMVLHLVQFCAEPPDAVVVAFWHPERRGRAFWRTVEDHAEVLASVARRLGWEMDDPVGRARLHRAKLAAEETAK